MTCITVPVGDYIAIRDMPQERWLSLPTTKEKFLLWVEQNSLDDSVPLVCNIVREYKIK